MDAPTFRTDFPEFADTTKYPDASVNFQITLAVKLLNECRWADLYDKGIELFTAHYLALGAQAAMQAAIGAAPGASSGPITQKTVDKVSYSMLQEAVTLADGGFWNMTVYGIQFLQLARLVGSGGMQL